MQCRDADNSKSPDAFLLGTIEKPTRAAVTAVEYGSNGIVNRGNAVNSQDQGC
jgi:hypothetical protein